MADPIITTVSFFSGYGGIDLGLRRVFGDRIRTIAYVERESYAASNLLAKMEEERLDAAPICTDVTRFPYRKFRGLVDIAHGGVPCQPHSCAGKRGGGADERFLFDDFIDGIAVMQPRVVFIENVPGLLTSRMPDGTLCVRYVLRRLEEVGYRVEDNQGRPCLDLFSAEEEGAPHRRKRVFILAVANSEGCDGRVLLQSWRSREAGAKSGGRGPTVADSGNGFLSLAGREQEGRAGVGPTGAELADAGRGLGAVRGERGDVARPAGALEGDGPERQRLRDAARDGGADVAEPASLRRGEGRAESGGEQGRRDAAERGLPVAHSSEQHGAVEGCEAPQRGRGRSDVEPVGVCLADANGAGCEQQRRPEPIQAQQPSAECAGGSLRGELDDSAGARRDATGLGAAAMHGGGECLPREGCGDVADSEDDQRRRELAGGAGSGADLQETARGFLPRFPPGPGLGGAGVLDDIRELFDKDPAGAWARYGAEFANTLRWGAILAVRPDLAPAVEPPVRGVADGLPGELVSTRVDELRIGGNGVVIVTVERAFRVLAERFTLITPLNQQPK